MSVEDREYVDAELMRDAYESGRLTEPAAVTDEIVRRANDAVAHPDRGGSREEAVASARQALVDRVIADREASNLTDS